MYDEMTQPEFVAFLLTLAELIESKAATPQEAAAILKDLAARLK